MKKIGLIAMFALIAWSCTKSGSMANTCELCQPAVGEFDAVEICETGPGKARYRIGGKLGENIDLDGRTIQQWVQQFCTGN